MTNAFITFKSSVTLKLSLFLLGHSMLNVNNYRITIPSIKFIFHWWRQKKVLLLQIQANAEQHILQGLIE